jgi:glyoxylase-like metal-dependent hydrolase (beta-lactamase superfamily II)
MNPDAQSLDTDPPILSELGIHRLPVPVPFKNAGGPVNVHLIDNADGSLTLFDAGLGSNEAQEAIRDGFRRLGRNFSEVRDVIISHGHVDHYGAAWMFAEAGAKVWVHPLDEKKVTAHGRWTDRDAEVYGPYLRKLGLTDEQLITMRASAGSTDRFARPVDRVELLKDGQEFRFHHFVGEILHMPGHTPGLVCMYDRGHRILFADDHVLARVSPNPLLELGPNGEADKFRALCTYFESARKARDLDADWVLPGHGPPFQDHRQTIDNLFGFYARRQEKLLAALKEGPKTAAELLPALFARPRFGEMYLMLSEVVGNLEVLEDSGKVAKNDEGGVYHYRLG